MKRSIVALMGATLVLALAMPSLAQGGAGGGRGNGGFGGRGMMGGGRGMGGGLFLLRNESVQKELAMTQPQIDKIDAKQQEVQKAMQDAMPAGGFQAMQNMSAEERQKMFAKITETQTKAVADILDTKQLARFNEISLQQAGPNAFSQPKVAEKLALTTDQKASIKKILDDAQAAQRAAFQNVDFRNMTEADRTKMMTDREAATKATLAKITALLKSNQLEAWNKMLGKPFKMVQPQFPGAPGGARQGGRRQGGAGGPAAAPGN